jgi:hypothetical protein
MHIHTFVLLVTAVLKTQGQTDGLLPPDARNWRWQALVLKPTWGRTGNQRGLTLRARDGKLEGVKVETDRA